MKTWGTEVDPVRRLITSNHLDAALAGLVGDRIEIDGRVVDAVLGEYLAHCIAELAPLVGEQYHGRIGVSQNRIDLEGGGFIQGNRCSGGCRRRRHGQVEAVARRGLRQDQLLVGHFDSNVLEEWCGQVTLAGIRQHA